jgi:hypothetical protein
MMKAGQKEMRMVLVGLVLVFIGSAWFALAVAGVLDGAAMMLGYFLGVGLALGGLIVEGVYLYRWQRILKLLRGEDVLAQWGQGENQTIIAANCAFSEGELYLWGIPGTRLEEVNIERQAYPGSERSYLQITFGEASSQARDLDGSRLWRTRKLSIHIPKGQELTAQAVLEKLSSRLSGQNPG